MALHLVFQIFIFLQKCSTRISKRWVYIYIERERNSNQNFFLSFSCILFSTHSLKRMHCLRDDGIIQQKSRESLFGVKSIAMKYITSRP